MFYRVAQKSALHVFDRIGARAKAQGDGMTLGLTLSIDAMGGDHAPQSILRGVDLFAREYPAARFVLHGDESLITSYLDELPAAKATSKVHHTSDIVPMDAKPSQAMRKRGTSMWNAIASVKAKEASACVSAGNTGALMAVAHLQLRTIEGLHRPAITASWPTPKGQCVVLDVGANVDSDPDQLVDFAIMGEAFSRALYAIERPSIGLLNVGTEDVKGHDDIREAMRLLRLFGTTLNLEVYGFVEGNDISMGKTDVVVTDGYTGNIALKTAEGAARLVGGFLKEALTSGPLSVLGALLASAGLKRLKHRMDPSSSNGGVFLGLNGLVIKSHGGTDARGFANALRVAARLAASSYITQVSDNLKRLSAARAQTQIPTQAMKTTLTVSD
ncbi:phosphate acyltransferase PlsX [Candidatus Phycosocius spiralis]|uniref:Phosphate acyltransferase n=1 Tax=Candidatus Phycosocius spiralis TaxID=2815099 RepID=A0ABQ4PYD7_9PROT|nr:phosphate acyltransferase PlsX [Candidatus Phycosocius spiralis]GIU67984.1 phosphate acyltransferase [Candidatus Phycosocius spiralis]